MIMQLSNARCDRPWRNGFTLIELLIAVAVISLLAGMLFPAIKMVRASAKSGQCSGNLRQIVIGIHAYASENRGNYPAGYWGASSNQYLSWDDQLAGLDGRDQLAATATGSGNDLFNQWLRIDATAPAGFRYYAMYTCPLESTIMTNSGANCWVRSYAWPTGYQGSGRGRDVSLSEFTTPSAYPGMYFPVDAPKGGGYSGSNDKYAMDWTAKANQVSSPSEKILLAEIRYLNDRGHLGGPWGVVVDGVGIQAGSELRPDGRLNNNGVWNSQITYKSSLVSPTPEQLRPLHRSKWNYLFADGHCQLLSEEESTANSSAMWKRN